MTPAAKAPRCSALPVAVGPGRRIKRCSRVDRALMAGLESFTRAARPPTRVRLSLSMGWVRIGFLIANSHLAPPPGFARRRERATR